MTIIGIIMNPKTISLCGSSFDFYWYNLTLLLVPIILVTTFIYEDIHGIIYVPLSCGVSAMIVFLNFPTIVIFLHSRPIYFDDLIIKNYEGEGYFYDDSFRQKYQRVFKWIASITSSLMIVLTVELWFFRDSMFQNDQANDSTKGKAVNSFVVLGVIGGMLRIYYAATMMIGRLLLTILKRLKRREQERLRLQAQDRTLVELTGIGVSIVDEDEDIPIIQRAASYGDLKSIIGFKPTLMIDIFN
jgi:hypothetical protein